MPQHQLTDSKTASTQTIISTNTAAGSGGAASAANKTSRVSTLKIQIPDGKTGMRFINIFITIDLNNKAAHTFENFCLQVAAAVKTVYSVDISPADITQFKYRIAGNIIQNSGTLIDKPTQVIPWEKFTEESTLTLRLKPGVDEKIKDKLLNNMGISNWPPEMVAHWIRKNCKRWETTAIAAPQQALGTQGEPATTQAVTFTTIADRIEANQVTISAEKREREKHYPGTYQDDTAYTHRRLNAGNLLAAYCYDLINPNPKQLADLMENHFKDIPAHLMDKFLKEFFFAAGRDPFLQAAILFNLNLDDRNMTAQIQSASPQQLLKMLTQGLSVYNLPFIKTDFSTDKPSIIQAASMSLAPSSPVYESATANFFCGQECIEGRVVTQLKLGPFYFIYQPGGKASFCGEIHVLDFAAKTATLLFSTERGRSGAAAYQFDDLFPFDLGANYGGCTSCPTAPNYVSSIANSIRGQIRQMIKAYDQSGNSATGQLITVDSNFIAGLQEKFCYLKDVLDSPAHGGFIALVQHYKKSKTTKSSAVAGVNKTQAATPFELLMDETVKMLSAPAEAKSLSAPDNKSDNKQVALVASQSDVKAGSAVVIAKAESSSDWDWIHKESARLNALSGTFQFSGSETLAIRQVASDKTQDSLTAFCNQLILHINKSVAAPETKVVIFTEVNKLIATEFKTTADVAKATKEQRNKLLNTLMLEAKTKGTALNTALFNGGILQLSAPQTATPAVGMAVVVAAAAASSPLHAGAAAAASTAKSAQVNAAAPSAPNNASRRATPRSECIIS